MGDVMTILFDLALAFICGKKKESKHFQQVRQILAILINVYFPSRNEVELLKNGNAPLIN